MNLDTLQRFPNQETEHRPTECVGETIADILGNIYNTPLDADFAEAAGFKAQSATPTTAGEDPWYGMLGACVYGGLPVSNETPGADQQSQLLESNYDGSYDAVQKGLALLYRFKGGVKPLYTYDDISNHLATYKIGVAMGMRWYPSFMVPDSSGNLRQPATDEDPSNHCVAVYEDLEGKLRIKPWLGPDFADKGYCYAPEFLFSTIFEVAYGFDPTINSLIPKLWTTYYSLLATFKSVVS